MEKYVFLLFLMVAVSSAAILQSGDGGVQFAKDTSAEKCTEPNVEAVYICNGNVVRVVSSLLGGGSTFYKPDGRVVECPVVAPTNMGAECMQMMVPNYCPDEEVCGASDATEIFPGQNGTVTPAEDEIQEETDNETPVPDETDEVPVVDNGEETNVDDEESNADNEDDQTYETTVVNTGTENPLGFLLPVVLFLGVAAIIILFLLFKNSIHHDV